MGLSQKFVLRYSKSHTLFIQHFYIHFTCHYLPFEILLMVVKLIINIVHTVFEIMLNLCTSLQY